MPQLLAEGPDLGRVIGAVHRVVEAVDLAVARPGAAGPAGASASPSGRAWTPVTRVPGWRELSDAIRRPLNPRLTSRLSLL